MFFVIAANIPFIMSKSSKKNLLNIFIIGAVLHIIFHHLLHKKTQFIYTQQFQKYYYTAITIDFLTAFYLVYRFENSDPEQNIETTVITDNAQIKKLDEYKKLASKRLQKEIVNSEDSDSSSSSHSEKQVVKPVIQVAPVSKIDNDSKKKDTKKEEPKKEEPRKEEPRKMDSKKNDTDIPVMKEVN